MRKSGLARVHLARGLSAIVARRSRTLGDGHVVHVPALRAGDGVDLLPLSGSGVVDDLEGRRAALAIVPVFLFALPAAAVWSGGRGRGGGGRAGDGLSQRAGGISERGH